MKKLALLITIVALFFLSGCGDKTVKMATTTSLNDSGLLDVLTKEFFQETGIQVQWVSVGSGEAMEIAKSGEVELAFLHAPAAEEEFVQAGYSMGRNIVMSNNFLIVGPSAISGTREEIVKEITENRLFASRADNSGTYKRELSLFSTTPNSYLETGLGMGDTLSVANEKRAYTLIDKATWVAHKGRVDLLEVYNNPEDLKNIYSLHQIQKSNHGKAFIDFVYSNTGQTIISNYGIDIFGEAVYILE